MTQSETYESYTYSVYYAGRHQKRLGQRLAAWRERRIIAAAFRSLGPITTVLDIPSGAGRCLPILASFRFRVIPADVSPQLLDQGRLHYPRFVHTPAPVVAELNRIALADESVDAVLCSRLLRNLHLPDDRIALMTELARVARVGCVATFFDAASLKYRRRLRRRLRKSRTGFRHAVTRQQFASEAERAGLRCVSMHAMLRYHSELTAAALLKQDA